MSNQQQKQAAIDVHSDQAGLFASRYEVIGKDQYKDSFVYSRMRLNKQLDRYLPADGTGLRLLDVGCGTGYHLTRYKDRGFEITGVDGSDEMLKVATVANPEIEFHQCDVDEIPLADNSFDIILCVEVLRYLPDISNCVAEMSRLLKPNGIALVTAAPLFQTNLYPLINMITATVRVGDLTQLKQYFHTSGRLHKEFADAQFEDIEVHGVYGGALNWVQRAAPSIMPSFLKKWEKIDRVTSDAPILKHFSNMFLVYAKKK